MKLFFQVNKVLFVIAALCFIFIGVAASNLPSKINRHTVLYDKNDCNAKLLIEEKGSAIYMRSNKCVGYDYKAMKYQMAEFHPVAMSKVEIE